MLTQDDVKLIQTAFKPQFDAIDHRFEKIEKILDRLAIGMVNVQEEQREQRKRIERLEEIAQGVYQKLDGFLAVLKRQDTEHQALRAHVERLEERLVTLEQKFAT